jgi:hypothetical protein
MVAPGSARARACHQPVPLNPRCFRRRGEEERRKKRERRA